MVQRCDRSYIGAELPGERQIQPEFVAELLDLSLGCICPQDRSCRVIWNDVKERKCGSSHNEPERNGTYENTSDAQKHPTP